MTTPIDHVEHITHNDLDAAACDIVIRAAFGSGAVNTRFCAYDIVDDEILRALKRIRMRRDAGAVCLLVISDISPTSAACWEALDAAEATGCMLACADHHATHAEEMRRRAWCVYDERACGAQLVFNLFRARLLSPRMTPLPTFVAAVDAYDRWQLDGQYRLRGETLHRLYRFMGKKTFVDEFVGDFARDRREDFRWLDGVLKERAEQEVKRICAEQVRSELFQDSADGTYVVVLSADMQGNEIAQTALSMYPALDFVVLIYQGNSISLRSRESGGIDISKIAQRLGGGGHRSAAGFPYALDEDLRRIVRGLLARDRP